MALQAGRRLLPQLFGPSWAAASSKLAEAGSSAFSPSLPDQGFGTPCMLGQGQKDEQSPPQLCSIPSLLRQQPGLLSSLASSYSSNPGLMHTPVPWMGSRRSISHLARQPLGLGLGLKRQHALNPFSPSLSPASRGYLTEGQVLGHAYLMATDIMFWTGLIGAVIFRRNLIVMLLATEIVMLACNLNFLFGSAYLNDMTGVIMSITITTIAACETAIGLALCVTYFHMRSATDVEALNFLK